MKFTARLVHVNRCALGARTFKANRSSEQALQFRAFSLLRRWLFRNISDLGFEHQVTEAFVAYIIQRLQKRNQSSDFRVGNFQTSISLVATSCFGHLPPDDGLQLGASLFVITQRSFTSRELWPVVTSHAVGDGRVTFRAQERLESLIRCEVHSRWKFELNPPLLIGQAAMNSTREILR